jgi:hypothetical protein
MKSPAKQEKKPAIKKEVKKEVKKAAQTALEKKNIKDAMANKNMRPPLAQKVSKKTAYDIKEASNPKMKASARKHYAMNAQAAMKNKKK